jgi:prepilin-type N-terminal cleavage/methylation domain-containing protein
MDLRLETVAADYACVELFRTEKPVSVAVSTMRTFTTITRLRGFTLIELVIVLLIISVLAGMAIPTFFDSLLFHQVESAARRVKSDLDLARRTARQTSSSQSIMFESDGSYSLSTAIKSLDNPHREYEVKLKASPFHLERVTADFEGEPSVSFDGYGAPTRGGTVELECKSLKCIIRLDAVTGEVTIDSSHSNGRTSKVAAPAEIN